MAEKKTETKPTYEQLLYALHHAPDRRQINDSLYWRWHQTIREPALNGTLKTT